MQRCLEEGVDTDKDGQIDRDEFRGVGMRVQTAKRDFFCSKSSKNLEK